MTSPPLSPHELREPLNRGGWSSQRPGLSSRAGGRVPGAIMARRGHDAGQIIHGNLCLVPSTVAVRFQTPFPSDRAVS